MSHISLRRSLRNTTLQRRLWLAATLLFWAVSLAGQAPEASVRGVVRNSAGQSLAGAKLTVSHSDTGLVQTAIGDSEGRYSFGSLPRGLYSLTAEMEGYQGLEKRGIELSVGARREENLTLAPLPHRVANRKSATSCKSFHRHPPCRWRPLHPRCR